MREFLEQIMHQSITESPYDSVEKIPLGCRKVFELTILEIQKQEILLATPIDTYDRGFGDVIFESEWNIGFASIRSIERL